MTCPNWFQDIERAAGVKFSPLEEIIFFMPKFILNPLMGLMRKSSALIQIFPVPFSWISVDS